MSYRRSVANFMGIFLGVIIMIIVCLFLLVILFATTFFEVLLVPIAFFWGLATDNYPVWGKFIMSKDIAGSLKSILSIFIPRK